MQSAKLKLAYVNKFVLNCFSHREHLLIEICDIGTAILSVTFVDIYLFQCSFCSLEMAINKQRF